MAFEQFLNVLANESDVTLEYLYAQGYQLKPVPGENALQVEMPDKSHLQRFMALLPAQAAQQSESFQAEDAATDWLQRWVFS